MRYLAFRRTLTACACTIAIALSTSSAALAALPEHLLVQTLEATPQEVLPIPGDSPEALLFSYAVAIRNGTAFVGMPGALDGRGRVAIFTQTASGWQRTGTLTAADEDDGSFGRSLAFRDGHVIVGASRAVYVFRRGNGQWHLAQRLARPDGALRNDPFTITTSMHFENGILLVGVPNPTPGAGPGKAYVYELNDADKFVLRTALTPSDSHDDDEFGTSVSVASGVIVVGAPGDVNSGTAGAAYVFRRNSSGAWVQRQRLVSSDTQADDLFGTAVAIDKGMIVIGAPHVDIEGLPFGPRTPDDHVAGGAAYGFVPVAGSFIETFKLRPRPDENFEYVEFGRQVEMFDKRIVVGALNTAFIVGTEFEEVHTYARDGSSVTPVGLVSGMTLSTSLGLANRWLLVGSPFDFRCTVVGTCIGEAALFDLSRFGP